MWLWLRKKLPKSFALWSKLSMYVGGLHLLVLFALFFVYKGDFYSFSLDLNRHIDMNTAVVFLPLQKKVDACAAPGSVNQSRTAKNESPVVKKKEKHALSSTKKKLEKNVTVVAAPQPKKKTKNAAKKTKKIVEIKKEKLDVPVIPPPEPVKEPIVPVPSSPIDQALPVVPVRADTASLNTGFDNVQYLGQYDLEALQVGDAIRTEFQKYWNPPPGVPKNAACQADITVSWEGMINFMIKKSSGIVMYDISVRSAMMKTTLPKQLWGKSFSITFKQ